MTTQQDQDVVSLLKQQHDQVKQIFAELHSAQGDRKRELFQELVRTLAVHETAEEEVVHPVSRGEAGDAVVDARLEEEDEAKDALSELYDMGPDDPRFDARLQEFSQKVVAHAEHEENEEFPALERGLSQERLRQLAGAVRAAEAAAPTRPHPHVGESATANVMAGPPAAVFDRLRDAVRDWRESHQG